MPLLQVCDDPDVTTDVTMSYLDSFIFGKSSSLSEFYRLNSGGRVHLGRDTSTIVNVSTILDVRTHLHPGFVWAWIHALSLRRPELVTPQPGQVTVPCTVTTNTCKPDGSFGQWTEWVESQGSPVYQALQAFPSRQVHE